MELHERAGIIGVIGHPSAARIVGRYLTAAAAPHHEAAGLVTLSRRRALARRVLREDLDAAMMGLELLPGDVAVGMVHDVPSRAPSEEEAWGTVDPVPLPLSGQLAAGPVAVAATGGLVNRHSLGDSLLEAGVMMQGPALLEELVAQLVARSPQRTAVNRVVDALWKLRGGFAVVWLTAEHLVAVRDPSGLRPLVLGRIEGATVVASDPAALRACGASLVRSVRPGEMLIVDRRRLDSVSPFSARSLSPCVHALASMLPDGEPLDGWSVRGVRSALGDELARVHPVEQADVVVPVDDAALPLALAYARRLERPLDVALLRDRAGGCRALGEVVSGRRVALVGPGPAGSRVRAAVSALLSAGATEVHTRMALPDVRRRCAYGVRLTPPEAPAWGAATTRASLDRERLVSVLAAARAGRPGEVAPCTACLGGAHPVPLERGDDQLPLFELEG